jgi:hypothetical protein
MRRTDHNGGLGRTAFRVVEYAEHFADHDSRSLEYWLNQPVAERLAAAMRRRRRINGLLPPLDCTHFRAIDLTDLDS